jgi:hypothetical protein
MRVHNPIEKGKTMNFQDDHLSDQHAMQLALALESVANVHGKSEAEQRVIQEFIGQDPLDTETMDLSIFDTPELQETLLTTLGLCAMADGHMNTDEENEIVRLMAQAGVEESTTKEQLQAFCRGLAMTMDHLDGESMGVIISEMHKS